MKSLDFWWRLIRPHTLSASFIPVFVGTAYAMQVTGHLRDFFFLAMLLASVAIQIATNLFNEYFDYMHGLDTKDSIGISGTIVRDGASPAFVMRCALALYGLALLLGVYLCWATSWWLAAVGALFMAIGFLYTGGPFPLSRTPFGELFAGGVMGPGIVLIAYYVQTQTVDRAIALISVPTFLLIALILTANNLRDRVGDQAAGRRTLAILLGHENTRKLMGLGFLLSFIWLFVLLAVGHHAVILLPFLAFPRVPRILNGFRNAKQTPLQMMPAMAETSKLNRDFGAYLALALILEFFL